MTQYRYMITRPCLLEGSLTIAKYMRPLFPQELYGQALSMRDEQGRDYAVRLHPSGNHVSGMSGLYHAMNLSVNDVLMLERTGGNEYRVQGVPKPYSRPQPPETVSKADDLPTRRVVIEASPHVREIRLEREQVVRAEPLDGKVEARREGEAAAPVATRAETLPAARVEVRHEKTEAGGAVAVSRSVGRPERAERDTQRPEVALAERLAAERVRAERLRSTEVSTVTVSREAAARDNVPKSVAEHGSETQPAEPLRAELINRDPERLAGRNPVAGQAQAGPKTARLPDILTGQGQPAPSNAPVTNAARPAAPQPVAAQPVSSQSALTQSVTSPLGSVAAALPSKASAEALKTQLQQLAELTGYQLEYLGDLESGGGPVRLRADMGAQSYDVMLALTEADMHRPAFKQGTYHALMTWEVDTASGAPRFTREALVALLENARLAPLTPLELRPYWSAASFDLSSVASVAEMVSAYLAQRGAFTYVLSTLAQQSAHSVVDPQRLAEKLGSGVNAAELRVVLDTLSRPPFMALLPMQGGQYYLRAEVSTILTDLSQYALGVARRLQPPTRAAAVRSSAASEATSAPASAQK